MYWWGKLKKAALIFFGLYVGAYVTLSLCGGYVLTQTGEWRYSWGLSVSDVMQWQPKFVFCQRFKQIDGSRGLRADFMGYIFVPMVLLDQKYVHKPVRILESESGK